MYQGRTDKARTRNDYKIIIRMIKTASCFTYDQSLMRKFDIICEKSSEIIVTKKGGRMQGYSFPKRWVKIKMPRQLSDEQRQKAAERAARNFVQGRRKSDEK